jgi:hypothetical protein
MIRASRENRAMSANGMTDREKDVYFRDHPIVRLIVFLSASLDADEIETLRRYFDARSAR